MEVSDIDSSCSVPTTKTMSGAFSSEKNLLAFKDKQQVENSFDSQVPSAPGHILLYRKRGLVSYFVLELFEQPLSDDICRYYLSNRYLLAAILSIQ